MMHKRFVLRQLTRSGKQASVFVLCVALSIVGLVAVNGFGDSIHRSLLQDARTLHGGDIILSARQPFSDPLKEAVATLEARNEVNALQTYEFYSVVRPEKKESSLLTQLKVVTPEYPFYGQVSLASGRDLRQVLKPGDVIVQQVLLDRLHLRVGDRLHVGSATLSIQDVVVHEPDRPVDFLSFGARIFVHMADSERLNLIRKGSRVNYGVLLKVAEPADLDTIADTLRRAADEGNERVETFRTARSRIKRFFDNFIFFLELIGMFTLLLSGIGIRSSLIALLREKQQTIAAIRAMGGSARFVICHFITVVVLLGLAGTLLGIGFGVWLQQALPAMLGDLLPERSGFEMSWWAVAEGFILGVGCVALFAFMPLYRLREIKPIAIIRKDLPELRSGVPLYLAGGVLFLFLLGMFLWQLEDTITGLWFVLGVLGSILVAALMGHLLLTLVHGLPVRALALRQAIRGLSRAGNATRTILVTLSVSLAVIFSIFSVEKNLDAAFVSTYPADVPNLFFIDIQPDQVTDFSKALGDVPRYYPIIRARLAAINGEKIDRQQEQRRRGDNLGRTFNLTYRNDLLDDEVLVAGESLFSEGISGLQVSVLDTVLEMRPMEIGDRLRFNIQGVPVDAVISSIRTRTRESIQPFFYFVFPEDSMLRDAPQSIFTAIRVSREDVGDIQNRMAARFPNVTPIDVTRVIDDVAAIARRLSMVIRFFTAFSILAGILIMISSVLATRLARTRETVYYKVLGADSRFVLTVFAFENAIIGLMGALIALIMSQAGSWLICTRLLEIDYHPYAGAGLVLVLFTVMLVACVGLSASIPILRQRPVTVLREQAEV